MYMYNVHTEKFNNTKFCKKNIYIKHIQVIYGWKGYENAKVGKKTWLMENLIGNLVSFHISCRFSGKLNIFYRKMYMKKFKS